MKKIKIKDSIHILKESEEIYQVIFTGIRRVKKFKVDFLVKGIIEELKEEKNEEELFSILKKKYNKKNIFECIASLESEGIVRRYDSSKIQGRYVRQISFIDELTSSWDETISLQKKLEDSVISVFGIGGIGTWIINGLSQIGIGEIRISDPDKIEESNLNRQLFFNSKDVGKYKVEVIKKKIARF